MNIKQLLPWVVEIDWTENIQNFETIDRYIDATDFTNKYLCSTKPIDKSWFEFLEKELNFWKLLILVNKIYPTKYTSCIWELIKMQVWDFLSVHTDSFHKVQWVLYLTDINEETGWAIMVTNKYIYPKKWTILLFPWTTEHAVTKVLKWNRITVSFWFNQ
jgi:hypothetical protein